MDEPSGVDWPWSWADIVNARGPMRFVNAYTRQCAKQARAEAAAHCALIISGSTSEDDDFMTQVWKAMWLRDLRRAGAGRAGAAPDPDAIERKRMLTRERVRKHRARKAASAADT
jgi:hypothetical protein